MAIIDGVSRLAANNLNTELILCVIVMDVATEFGAVVLLMTYLLTVITDYHAGPDTISSCMTGTSTVVAVT